MCREVSFEQIIEQILNSTNQIRDLQIEAYLINILFKTLIFAQQPTVL